MSLLKAKHWKKWGVQAEFQVKLAAQNSPPMKMGGKFMTRAVMLVQEAYNRIRFEHHLTKVSPEHGIYDLVTSECIGKFQEHFNLRFLDGNAGAETIRKMDVLLVEIEKNNSPLRPHVFPWEVFF